MGAGASTPQLPALSAETLAALDTLPAAAKAELMSAKAELMSTKAELMAAKAEAAKAEHMAAKAEAARAELMATNAELMAAKGPFEIPILVDQAPREESTHSHRRNVFE